MRAAMCAGLSLAAVLGCLMAGPVELGEKAPDFSVLDLSGEPIGLEDLRGRDVLVHFWATWCPPCIVELPGLSRFFSRLDSRRVVLLAVCVDRMEPVKIRQFLRDGGFEIPVYRDPGGKVAARFGTFKFPETYVLDSNGIVRQKVVGPGKWEDPAWEQFLHGKLDHDRL